MGSGESTLSDEESRLEDFLQSAGNGFPGSDYHPLDRKNWMAGLDTKRLRINKIVWPGTHNSATNGISEPLIARPIGECQNRSIYDQLVIGTRVLDIRIEKDRWICHGPLLSYSIDVVFQDIKRFLSETSSEIIILEVRTEYGKEDAPNFQDYLVKELGKYLIHQDEGVFKKTVSELLTRRIICVWKPRNSSRPTAGGPLWSDQYLQGDWDDTDSPYSKIMFNLEKLRIHGPASTRKYFYKVEHTTTAQVGDKFTVIFRLHELSVQIAARRIKRYAIPFIARCFVEGLGDHLQIFSTDYIEPEFMDACIGLTRARIAN